MPIRGVYNEDEKKMLEGFEKTVDKMSGWYRDLHVRVASADSIRNWSLAMDCWNPLWLDENYAQKTRWGGIIAPPMYQECIILKSWMMDIPPHLGYISNDRPILIGEDWELFKPVRPGDSFRVWRRRAKVYDVTSPDKDTPRRFNFLIHDLDLINQKDEMVTTFKCYLNITLKPEPPQALPPSPPYAYTEAELAFIERISNAEEIRGAEPRYWEDVGIGDELKPVAMGPTTAWDMLVFTAGRQDLDLIPMMEVRRRTPWMLLKDPDTGVTYHMMEMHLTGRAGQLRGEPHGFHSGVVERQLMARLVTNWMGDDGFIRKFNWRYLTTTYIGEALIGKAKVVNKRAENGEHLVDLEVWLENIRGHFAVAAKVTVNLCAKEDL
jgi:acyl dehydratase